MSSNGWRMSCDGRVGDWTSLHLCHSSFSNTSIGLPTSQLILQAFRCFTYVTAHSPTFPSFHLHHSSFSNPSVSLPTSQLILQPFRCFTYVTAHSSTIPSLCLRHSSFSSVALIRHSSCSKPSAASPMPQLIFQPFLRFSYVTGSSLTSPGKPPMESRKPYPANVKKVF